MEDSRSWSKTNINFPKYARFAVFIIFVFFIFHSIQKISDFLTSTLKQVTHISYGFRF